MAQKRKPDGTPYISFSTLAEDGSVDCFVGYWSKKIILTIGNITSTAGLTVKFFSTRLAARTDTARQSIVHSVKKIWRY